MLIHTMGIMMIEASSRHSPEVLVHLLALTELRDKSHSIQSKIEEVTARLQHAIDLMRNGSGPAHPRHPLKLIGDQAIVGAMKDLDDMLGQPDLMTRDELRSRLQDLIHRLEGPGSN